MMKVRVMASLMMMASLQAAAEDIRQALAPTLVEMAFSEKQNALFVSAPDWKQEGNSSLLRLNPQTLKPEVTLSQDVKGFGVALDDKGNRLYLTQGFNGSVGVVDTLSNKTLAKITLQKKVNLEHAYRAAGISGKRLAYLLAELKRFGISDDYLYKVREARFDARSERLFMPGLGYGVESVLYVVNTRTQQLEKVIPGFGFYATGIAIDEAGRRVFVSNMQGQLITLNADTLEVENTQEIAADQLLNLVYDAGTNRLLGVDQGIDRDKPRNNYLEHIYTRRSNGHQLFALDADSGKVLAQTNTGKVPISLLLDTSRQQIYVTNRNGVRVEKGEGTLMVFNSRTLKPLETLNLPPHPNSLALDSKNGILFVTVKNDGAATKAGNQESVVRISR